MKHACSMSILAACLLLLAPTAWAQDCGTWSLSSLRGTYGYSASGWQDLSEINPALPPGYAPVAIVGAFSVASNGELTGWASINAGGVQLTADFVNSHFGAPNADCSVPIVLSMRIREFEGVVGPYSYTGAIAGDMAGLEIVYMMRGTGPGGHVDLQRARRISMKMN